MLHTNDEFHVSLPCGLRRTIWQLETPVVAPAPGANMPLSPSSVANAERMEKLSRTIRDSVSFLFERIVIIFLVVDGWFFFCFMFFFLWWFDCEVLTLTLCFTKFPSSDRFWRCSRRFFLVAGVTVLPRWLESSGVKRGGTLDITSCLQRTDSAGCREWIRVMLYKRDVRVFDNWSRNAISYALALTCNYFQISSGKELFWHLVIAGHPVVVENMW